eukprot:13401485-Alexandrium_andersonii.AAC.1
MRPGTDSGSRAGHPPVAGSRKAMEPGTSSARRGPGPRPSTWGRSSAMVSPPMGPSGPLPTAWPPPG